MGLHSTRLDLSASVKSTEVDQESSCGKDTFFPDELTDEEICDKLSALTEIQLLVKTRLESELKGPRLKAEPVDCVLKPYDSKIRQLTFEQREKNQEQLRQGKLPDANELRTELADAQPSFANTEQDHVNYRDYYAERKSLWAEFSERYEGLNKAKAYLMKRHWLRSTTLPDLYLGMRAVAVQHGLTADETSTMKTKLLVFFTELLRLEDIRAQAALCLLK